MKKRRLGNTGLEIAPFVLGGNVFGWTVREETAFNLLDAFVGAGFNLIDTADVYSTWVAGHSGGESETIIGQWLKRRSNRRKVLIATKVGLPMGPGRQGLSKAYIQAEVEESLKRLQTDYIDLYQAHADDPGSTLDETLDAFETLIKQGKVRAIGASNYSSRRLVRALEISGYKGFTGYQTLQPRYNLYDREEYEREFEPLVKEKGLGVITYSSLASGFLSGKYRYCEDLAVRARGPMVSKYLNERGFRILKALDEAAQKMGAKPATIALAWLMARNSVTAPIASATSIEQLDELIKAASLELDRSVIAFLDEASAY
ncbi:MAG: aldo/keto reductase [Nitrospiraceae bacterium]|nr:aldo/keto reductase [Nitrospiraceae bacterium]